MDINELMLKIKALSNEQKEAMLLDIVWKISVKDNTRQPINELSGLIAIYKTIEVT
jgi:hypothetical protein